MCDICDGKTFEATLTDILDHVRTTGWALSGVESEPDQTGWAYTIGLMDSYDHPELVIVDDDWARGASILNSLGRAVRDGEAFVAGDLVRLGTTHAELVAIHPVHLAGDLMGMWHNVRMPGNDALALSLEAYQLVVHGPLPDGGVLPAVRLDDPETDLVGPDPDAAA